MNKELNAAAQSLGQLSWESRSKDKTKKQRSEMMKELAKKSAISRRAKLDNKISK